MQARSAKLVVLYNSKDISSDIAKFIKSFSYNDVMSGEADDVSITLEDRDELWEGDWLPDKGALLTMSIITTNWEHDGQEEFKLGEFEVDDIALSGPPHEATIKAISVPNNNELRGINKTRAWEKTKLSVIAKDIADDASMTLLYDTDTDTDIERAEQTDQSDLSFLLKLCKDSGLALKIADKKIIVLDEVKYEAQTVATTIYKFSSRLKHYSIRSKMRDIYMACHEKYQEPKTNAVIEYTFTDPDKLEGKTLELNKHVKSIAEAEAIAKKELREKNKEEITISMDLMGSFLLSAGNTVNISGFHTFDNYKYIIIKGRHELGSSGYTTSIDLRKCLNGY